MKAQPRSWIPLLPILAIWLMGTEAAGQAPRADSSRIEPPAYQPLRFEEDWSALARSGVGGGRDQLKVLPLNPTGDSYVSVGGQLRHRLEGVRNFMLVG